METTLEPCAAAPPVSPDTGSGRLRVGLVTVRFTLFDPQMPADFPVRMRAHAARSAEILRTEFEVIETGVIEDEEGAAAAARLLSEARPDALVFAPPMAAPPSFAATAIGRPGPPTVIWNAPTLPRLPHDLSQAAATEHTTTVGCVMYANVRVRDGRPAPVVTAAHDAAADIAVLLRTVRATAAAGRLRGATVLRVGDPIAGYLDVETSRAELDRLGVREVAIPREEWEDAVESVRSERLQAELDALAARGWRGDPGPNVEHSARITVALTDALDRAGAIGGTVNCHGPWFRGSPRVGVTACLAVACLSELDRPLACTGDQPTGILLSLVRRVAGASLYCECYAPESATGLMLVAAGGEGDPAWAEPAGAVTLEANTHYPGARGAGTSVAFGLRPGPATLLSLSPTASGWVLAWATGEITETRYSDMRGPNGMFRFDAGDIGQATSRWIASGATHHNALAPGRLDVEVPALAAALGIATLRV